MQTNQKQNTAQLVCTSISRVGPIASQYGELIRYQVRFQEGLEGEYWAKSEKGADNFRLNTKRWYAYEPLTKKDGPDTLKFRPCKSGEIPQQSSSLPGGVTLPPIAPPPTSGSMPPQSSAVPVVSEAFRASIQLASHGRIDFNQIEPTARALHRIIQDLQTDPEEEVPF
jgi:hypothetical protein